MTTISGLGQLGLYSQYSASTGIGGPKSPPDASEMSSEFLATLDTDGDSLLSMDELGQSEEMFEAIDTDGDGAVSEQELLTVLSDKLSEMGPPPEGGMQGPPPGGGMKGPPPEGEGSSESLSIDQVKSRLGDILSSSTSQTESTDTESTSSSYSGQDMIAELLSQLGLSDDESSSLISMLSDSQFSVLA